MPCSDGGYCEDDEYDFDGVVAYLCGIVTVLEKRKVLKEVLADVNWDDVGRDRKEFDVWWKTHKEDDARRVAEELQNAKLRMKELQETIDRLYQKQSQAERTVKKRRRTPRRTK